MDWVKRNLIFVVGTAVAVGLLLFSGFYLYSNSRKNNDARELLEAEYNELNRLHNLKPHPGKGDVDNIRLARQQKAQLQKVIQTVSERFEPIPAIPASTNVTGEQFSAALRGTIDQLNRRADASSVIVPTSYNFSFEAEKRLVKFAPGSLDGLAVQLGEVSAIAEILFLAKVNKLTGLRRERISPDDRSGPQSDYLRGVSVTNELAVISPYEVSFESFSAELADVISGFANSSHGIIIKGFNVQPAGLAAAAGRGSRLTSAYGEEASAAPPVFYEPAVSAYPEASPGARYGGGGIGEGEFGAGAYGAGGGSPQIRRPTFSRPAVGAGAGSQYGVAAPSQYGAAAASRYGAAPSARYDRTPPSAYQPAYAQPRAGYPTAGAATGASQTLIDEHPLSVNMVVQVIKLLPPEEE